MSVESRKMERRPPPLRTNPDDDIPSPVDCILSLPMKIPGRNSPRASWEETMSDLSRGLQMICGSPPSVGPMSPGRFNHPLASPAAVFAFGDGLTSPLTSTPRKVIMREHSRELHRANSIQGQGSPLARRPIFVRHIETQAELRNRLAEICRTGPTTTTLDGIRRTGSPVPSTAHAQKTTRPLALTKLLLNQSVCRVRVAPHRAEDLIVSVGEGRRLATETISGSGGILHQSTLRDGVPVRRLVADVNDDGVLCVRERGPNTAEVMFNNTGSSFVPIVRQDESKLELTIVLHVPRNFRFEDISVQTVDDRVVVMGKKRSLPPGVAFNFRSRGSALPTFRVSLQLPSGTDSRSVSASLTRHHQLIIRGTLGPLSRRSTV